MHKCSLLSKSNKATNLIGLERERGKFENEMMVFIRNRKVFSTHCPQLLRKQ